MPEAEPLITMALQTEVPSGRRVWNLHTDDGNLIGWTPEKPGSTLAKPSCFEYGTGGHRRVTLSPDIRVVPLA